MVILGVIVLALAAFLSVATVPPGVITARTFVDLPSAVFVLGGSLGGLLLSHNRRCWKLLWTLLQGRRDTLNRSDRQELSCFLQTGSRASVALGVLGTLAGGMIILSDMGNLKQLGWALAATILTVFYGLLLSEVVFQPMRKTVMEEPARSPRGDRVAA